MFGTFAAEDDADRPNYGLVKDFEHYNPFRIFIHEYWGIVKDVLRPGLSPLQRLLYIIAPPGWSHDGSRLTSTDIKREAGLLDDTPRAPAE
jgi:hypothetical protein